MQPFNTSNLKQPPETVALPSINLKPPPETVAVDIAARQVLTPRTGPAPTAKQKPAPTKKQKQAKKQRDPNAPKRNKFAYHYFKPVMSNTLKQESR